MATHTSKLEKLVPIITTVLGQAPWIATITGAYPLSLYQPAIYRGKELFLVVPVMVAIVATWAAVKSIGATWAIFVIFLVVVGLVYWIYTSAPTLDPIHTVNWILFYCAFALLFAALTRLIVD